MKKDFKFYSLWLGFIIIVFFVLQIFINGFTDLFVLNDRANNGEFWRFVTAIFLHGGVSHLVYNLFALVFFGLILESLVGSRKFLWVFFISGIGANVFAVNYYDSSLGASGAIYGIIGALTVLRPLFVVFAFGLPMPMIIASFLWIVGNVLRSLGAFGPTNIGAFAHLAGIFIGFIIGIILRRKKSRNNNEKVVLSEKLMNKWENEFMKDI